MYNTFFGFREKPFKLVPNPDFLYLSRSHQIALAHLTYAVDQGDGFVVITGEVGTGKTTLCRIFLERLDERTDSAYIFYPKLDSVQLLTAISNEFGIRTNHTSVKQLLDVINGFLIMKNQEDRKVILLIDEAQNLSVENLEMVRMLSNLETTRSKLLQIILVGQPELGDKLDTYELRQLAQRISLSTHLSPLGQHETTGYIQHRVNIAAQRQVSLFTRSACRAIHQYANGIPRMINIACDRALLTAYSLDRPKVTAAVARMAIREITSGGRSHPRWIQARNMAWVLAVLGILIITGLFYLKMDPFGSHAQSTDLTSGREHPDTYPITPFETHEASASQQLLGNAVPDTPPSRQSWPAHPPGAEPSGEALAGLSTSADIAAAIDRLIRPESRLDAVTRVLACWDQPAPHPAQLPTMVGDQEYFDIAAHQYGLRIHAVNSDWALVRQLNLPAIVALKKPDARPVVYMALVSWENGVMQLSCGDTPAALRTDLNTLMPYLHGTAYVYWKNILGFDGIVNSRAPDRTISAVKAMLRRVGYAQLGPAAVFDHETRRAILDFQMQHHLAPDGLLGPLTKMILIREAGAFDFPRLVEDAVRGGA